MGYERRWVAWLLLILLAFIWGSSFILIKYGLGFYTVDGTKIETFNGYQLGALRIFIAFLALMPLLFKYLKKEYLRKWRPLIVVAICGNGLPAFLFGLAEERLDSGLVGMLNSFTVVFTLLIGVYLFKLRPKWFNIVGISIATFGAVVLGYSGYNGSDSSITGVFLVILATIFYAISLNTIKYKLNDVPSPAIATLAFLFIGPLCGFLALYLGVGKILSDVQGAFFSLGMIALLAVVGTAFALVVFNTIIKTSSAVFASSVTYLIPIVALLWGIYDGELLTGAHFSGMAIILLGVYLVNRK